MKETREMTGRASNTPEAKIAICKCKESKKLFGVRFEEDGDGWNERLMPCSFALSKTASC